MKHTLQIVNLATVRHDVFKRKWIVLNTLKQPYDWQDNNIVGAKLTLRNANGFEVFQFTTEDFGTAGNANGRIELNTGEIVLFHHSLNLRALDYNYDFELIDSNGYKFTRIGGVFKVLDDLVSDELNSFANNSDYNFNGQVNITINELDQVNGSLTIQIDPAFTLNNADGLYSLIADSLNSGNDYYLKSIKPGTNINFDVQDTSITINTDAVQVSYDYVDQEISEVLDFVYQQDQLTLQNANAYTDQAITLLTNYVNTQDTNILNSANDYTDVEISELKDYVDQQDALTLSQANNYTDQEILNHQSVAYASTSGYALDYDKTYVDQQDALTLSQANNYTDQEILNHQSVAYASTSGYALDSALLEGNTVQDILDQVVFPNSVEYASTSGYALDSELLEGNTVQDILDQVVFPNSVEYASTSGYALNVPSLSYTNGITRVSNTIKLGGALTETTNITGNFQFTLNTENSSISLLRGSVMDGFKRLDLTSTGVTLQSTTHGTLILGNSGNVFRDDRATKIGLEYNADYSDNYSNRSLVDKEYVVNSINEAVFGTSGWINPFTFTNGLTYDNDIIKLGGTLTENTIIDCSSLTLQVVDANSLVFSANNNQISIGSGISIVLSGADTLRYASDYSSNFVNRSLVDKEYVDNKTNAPTADYASTAGYALNSALLQGYTVQNILDQVSNSSTSGYALQAGNSYLLAGNTVQDILDQIVFPNSVEYASTAGYALDYDKTYIDQQDIATLNSANGYTDGEISAITYFDKSVNYAATSGFAIHADFLDGHHGEYYLNRANHTGTQLSSTVSDFNAAADARVNLKVSGTVNTVAKFTDTNVVGNSAIIDQATNSGIWLGNRFTYVSGQGSGGVHPFTESGSTYTSNRMALTWNYPSGGQREVSIINTDISGSGARGVRLVQMIDATTSSTLLSVGGTGNASILGSLSVGTSLSVATTSTFTGDATFNGNVIVNGQAYAVQSSLSDAATINWNLNTDANASVTLAGNRTLANPTNMKAGGTYYLIVRQDGTGNRTLSYGSVYKFPGGVKPVLTTLANAVDIITFISDGTNMYGVIQNNFF